MQFVLVIYHGTYPLPGTPAWESVSEEERKAAYADYAALNKMENVTPGPPRGRFSPAPSSKSPATTGSRTFYRKWPRVPSRRSKPNCARGSGEPL